MNPGGENISSVCSSLQVQSCPLEEIFENFKTTDKKARQSNQEAPVIRVAEKNVFLFKREGKGWKAFSRKFQLTNGEWRVVQTLYRENKPYPSPYMIKIFDGMGTPLVYTHGETPSGHLVVKVGYADSQLAIINGAIKAVTGRDIPTVSWLETFM